MEKFNKYEHLLFKGEYARRDRILSGLTIEEVTHTPAPGVHTIYDELWHARRCQNIEVNNDEQLFETSSTSGEMYPKAQAKTQQEWDNLVTEFLDGITKAIDYAKKYPENLKAEAEPGVTNGDNLECLAAHNAYHLGKIVLLRQIMGIWPPKEKS